VFAHADAFLKYFAGVRRRTIRDVATLPPEAEAWVPQSGDGEAAWGIPKIIEHVAESPIFFVSAYSGDGWVWEAWPEQLGSREGWVPALEASGQKVTEALTGTPAEWTERRVPALGDPSVSLAGWRVLMMMTEHEIAHRAQLTTYAGLNGWPVHQIFDRTNEWVVAQREQELRERD
jgi:uncharacterized damage-inducible protein DinB